MVHLVVPLLVAGLLPFVLTGLAKVGAKFSMRDNHETRKWQAQLSGWPQRAYWAHQNAFETFPLFASAAIVAHIAAPGNGCAVAAAWAYPFTRVLYSVAFIADRASLRSVLWFSGMFCSFTLFAVALGAFR